MSAGNGSGRRHHLDAIRVSAILLLIPYHAARYVQKGDGDPRIVDAAVWFVHTWHMPLFFAISGFLAASALRRSTAARQVRARFRRLGVPLVVGMLTVVPLANFFVIEAAALWPRKGALPAKRELDLSNIFNLTPRHLWFISYLLIISLLAIGIWLAVQRAPRLGAAVTAGFGRLMRSWWAVPALASISAAILATKTGWVAGGSEDGGREELVEFWFSRSCRSWICSCCSRTWARFGPFGANRLLRRLALPVGRDSGVAVAHPTGWLSGFPAGRSWVSHPGPCS